MPGLFLFLSAEEKVGRWHAQLRQIHQRYRELDAFTDVELRKESLSLRYRAQTGEPLERMLTDAFAVVRQAADRAHDMPHYNVQLLGGMAMQAGKIAVMQTGEGKTLAATLPLYLAALSGQGAHLVTANDYLAQRDAQFTRPLFELLGMRVGTVVSSTPRPNRIDAYRCDITYSTAKEIGFDFLRDRLWRRHHEENQLTGRANFTSDSLGYSARQQVQRILNFVVVDEADSILIDEARTPLIISSLPSEEQAIRQVLFQWAAQIAGQFVEEKHYEFLPAKRNVQLNSAGRLLARKLDRPTKLAAVPLLDLYAQIELALLVECQYVRDRDYVVRDDEIVIVDEFTGRLTEGRKWRSGLHQAIEAREGVSITAETSEAARITVQDLFLNYKRLSGMTGTIANSAPELKKIYRVGTIHVPPNKTPRRQAWPDRVFRTAEEKWQAIVDEIRDLHERGRPILVGTRSIDKSESLSNRLSDAGLEHSVLNARYLSQEAEIIAGAGQVGRITVATNMAGRGTDIQLTREARENGGLHVIGTERHDSARIDHQLSGRCGRQGDPGTYRFFVSLEDELLEAAFSASAMQRTQRQTRSQSLHPLTRLFIRAQRRIESRHFRGRKMLLHQERRRQMSQAEMGQDPYVDTII